MRAAAVPDLGATPELIEIELPDPGPDELVVQTHAAGVNPFGWKVDTCPPNAADLDVLAAQGIDAINFYNTASAASNLDKALGSRRRAEPAGYPGRRGVRLPLRTAAAGGRAWAPAAAWSAAVAAGWPAGSRRRG
jgi:hypothetical protein